MEAMGQPHQAHLKKEEEKVCPMPEGRLINRKIVDNERLAAVPFEAEGLFWRMILFLDREGRLSFPANATLIRNKLFPLRDFTVQQVEEWLRVLAGQKKDGKGLIELYEVEGRRYLWMPGFKGEQSKSWLNTVYYREAPSDIPAPPGVKDIPPDAKSPKVKDIIDPRLADMVKLYEDNIGICTPAIYEKLKDFSKEYPEEGWFEKAVSEAVKNEARSLAYIEKILERYKKEGFNGKPGKGRAKSKRISDDPDKFIKGKYGHVVER
jgi:DnaD/phage-associated family protein